MRWFSLSSILCLTLSLIASPSAAQQDTLGLVAPKYVVDSGVLNHILPRFSLKTGVRVVYDPIGEMVLADTPPGTAVFQGNGVVYYLRVADDPRQIRFRDWLISKIGRRTVDSFQPDGAPLFDTDFSATKVEAPVVFEGDSDRGAQVSLRLCGRCHVIGPQNRMAGLGSTPSFMVLRTLPDWDTRFQQFYVLNPHGAFTQIVDVTPPFDPQRPSPIAPVELTLQDLESILAFVANIVPADLGNPLQSQ